MLNLNSVMVFSQSPEKLGDFYSKVFGKKPDWTGGEFLGFKVGAGMMVIGPHDKVKGRNLHPERIMFQFETSEMLTEFERISKLGAKVIAKPYHPAEAEDEWLGTLEDIDGNYFQLLSPMEM